ncbi:MAG: hypothetical protein NTY76_02030 [Candidatus Omnitrophica bacterium]|nr:hypothetical protein [Candidatus Omnitrophota bacterium]
MIKLTISNIIFLYALFSVIIILIVWIVSGYRQTKRVLPKEVEHIWKCSICFNTYVDSKHDDISVCPLCGSYNKRE